jgi:hypothetical protein
MSEENETLRWPGNLDQAGIVQMLVLVRESAKAANRPEFADRFAGIEESSPAQIGAVVISALNWVEDKAEYQPYAKQLGILAMNLKNLRQPGKD